MELDLSINSNIKLIPTSPNSNVNFVTSTIKFYPKKDFRQEVLSTATDSNPKADISTQIDIEFKWDKPDLNYLYYNYQAKIKTKTDLKTLAISPKYPLNIKDKKLLKYAEPTKYITITPEIVKKSDEIIEGEKDIYLLTSKLAIWVKENIKYDFNSLTAKAVQTSTWVLTNKQGVCDELTNLFISFLRSQGIPARFVSGTVYSSVDNKWTPHGWAEVHFPDKGWIPYDPTFGQYGWIDATHIKLSDSDDPSDSAVSYHWVAEDTDLTAEEFKIQAEPVKLGKEIEPIVKLSVTPIYKKVSHNSYIPVQVTVTNTEPYYITPEIYLSKAPGIVGSNTKAVPLKPKESKNLYWLVTLPQTLEKSKKYYVTLEADSILAKPSSIDFEVSKDYDEISKTQAEKKLRELESSTKPVNFNSITTYCSPDKTSYTESDRVELNCLIENKGNTDLKDLDFCANEKDCKNLNLDIGEKKEIKLKTRATDDLKIGVKNDEITRNQYLNLNVLNLDENKFLQFSPREVEYNKEVELFFIINTPEEIYEVDLDLSKLALINYNKIDRDTEITFKTNTKKLVGGIRAKITYKDKNGNQQEKIEFLDFQVLNTPWYIKLLNYIS